MPVCVRACACACVCVCLCLYLYLCLCLCRGQVAGDTPPLLPLGDARLLGDMSLPLGDFSGGRTAGLLTVSGAARWSSLLLLFATAPSSASTSSGLGNTASAPAARKVSTSDCSALPVMPKTLPA